MQTGDTKTSAPDAVVAFRCNLCGTPNQCVLSALAREISSCTTCDSTVRFRAIGRLVTRELLGREIALCDAPVRKDLAGLGLSDAAAYATPLAAKFAYVNTWFHTEPPFDIANVPEAHFGRYDFVIASEVFEHVAPPIAPAFDNARKLLKPGGKLIFTAPFSLDAVTREHFPDLHEWNVAEVDGQWRLRNRTADGEEQVYTDLVFHGGPGATLEMRLFSCAALEREFERAGFARVRIADEAYLPFGIHWPHRWSLPMVATAPGRLTAALRSWLPQL